MKLIVPQNTTSKSIYIFVQDSTSTTGAGLTGLVFNTASLTCYYIRAGQSSATAVSLVTATLGTWTSGGFIVTDGTNMPGVYELGIPNACLTGGTCILYLKGAANMVPVKIEIQTETINATANVTQFNGVTCQTINGYLLTNSTDRRTITSGTTTTFIPSSAITNPAGKVGYDVVVTAGSGLEECRRITGWDGTQFTVDRAFTVAIDNTCTVTFKIGNNPALNSSLSVLADIKHILGSLYTGVAGYFLDWSVVQNKASTVALTGTTISTSQQVASVSGAVGSVTGAVGSVTGNVGGNVTGTVASVVGNVGGNVTGSVGSVVGAVGSVTAGVTVTTNNDKSGYSLTVLYDAAKTAASATALASVASDLTTALAGIAAIFGKFTGITSLAKWLGIIAGKTADAPTLAEVNATTAGVTYDNTLHSLEKLGSGGGGATQADVEAGTAEVIAAIGGLGSNVTVTTPLSEDGTALELVRGDSYTLANGRSIPFSITGQDGLIGSVAHIRLYGETDDLAVSPAITSGTESFVFSDILAAKTNALKLGAYTYQIRFINGIDVATPIEGTLTMKKGY